MSVAFTIGTLEDARVVGLDGPTLAVAIARAMYDRAEVAYIANAADGPDGVIACSIAAAAEAPMLLTDADALPAATADELARLGVRSVVIVAGTAHVSGNVARALDDRGLAVSRLERDDAAYVEVAERLRSDRLLGSDRFARSVALAVASMPATTPVFVSAEQFGVVLHAPDAVPVPAGRVIDALAPSIVAVFEGK